MKLKAALCAAVALAGLGLSDAVMAAEVDGPAVHWRIGAWGKRRATTEGAELVRKLIDEKTDGKFKWTIGYESFGSPKELLDLVKVGSIDGTQICSSYHPEKTPAYTGLDLPFLPVTNQKVQQAMEDGYHRHPVIVKEFAGWNAMPYMGGALPQYEFVGRGKAPQTLQDFKGMRVRAIGGIGDAMRLIGAVPTSMDPTEVYNAMERGTIDAVSLPSTYAHGSYRTFEIGKWFTTNLAPGTQACPWLFNIEAYNKLPEQYKKLLTDVRQQGIERTQAANKEADDKNIPLFKQKKLVFVTFKEDELAQFRKVGAEPVWEEWVKKREAQGIPGRELLDFLLKTAKDNNKS